MTQPKPIKQYQQLTLEVLKAQGTKRVNAKIISLAFTEPQELTLEELAKQTNYSLATVSNTARYLESIKIIERVRKPRSKKLYIRPRRDFLKNFEENLKQMHETQVVMTKQELPELIRSMKQDIKNTKQKEWKEHYKQHLKVMKNHYKQVQIMDDVFSRIMTIIKDSK